LAIDSIGARRVAIDTIEVLFAGLSNAAVLRAELRRLFRWLKQKGVTTVITGEHSEGAPSQHGLEEYVSDCVIRLDHRVTNQVSTRRLRVVKYRGSIHGTNEYPFLISRDGIAVLPITSRGLQFQATEERVSSGVPQLDAMLGGDGYFRATTVLISGTAGTGKTSLAAHFVRAAAKRGERALYFTFEESASQLIRNMRSIGIDLQLAIEQDRLLIHAARPTLFGLEAHLALMQHIVLDYRPQVVVIDPVTSLTQVSTPAESHAMLVRIIDLLKQSGITALLTSLTNPGDAPESSEAGISSLIDTWIMLQDLSLAGERNRSLNVLKSRGMAHSNQVREFLLTSHGVELLDVYVGASGVLTGRARQTQEARENITATTRALEVAHLKAQMDRRRQAVAAQIAALAGQLEAEEQEMLRHLAQQEEQVQQDQIRRSGLAHNPSSDPAPEAPQPGPRA
jgi:circadian clock protein KaiC